LLISVDTGPFSIVLGSDAADFIADAQDSAGLDTRYNAQVKGITLDETTGKTRIELGEGDALVTDIILAGTGVRPSTAWLESSGMRFDRGILCAEDLQTSLPDVYAIGDIARWPGGPFGELVRLEHWTNASDQGAHIAHVLATGSPARGADLPLPFFSSQLHGNRVASIGFPAQAEQTAAFRDDGRMLVLYGKNEQLIGALVVNNTALLARFTPLVQERISWQDALAAAAAVAPVGVTA
jgi:NADPH-dependent 2,4-dienoyl-CoA reductase/sulfur reductase-like enzyme